jgi:ribonuclease BN (tRNA processing enzyme)
LSLKNHKSGNKLECFNTSQEIYFLGTASMEPLPNRTVSSILLSQYTEKLNIMFDCGDEGTYF